MNRNEHYRAELAKLFNFSLKKVRAKAGRKGGKAGRGKAKARKKTSAEMREVGRARWAKKLTGMTYIKTIPKGPLPEGQVLVHNQVRPQRQLGMNGFRAWTQKLDADLEVCPCHWAGVNLHGLTHYRVKAVWAGEAK